MVHDVFGDLRLALIDPGPLVRHDRVRAHALGVQAREEPAVLVGRGVVLLDVRDGDLAERVHDLEVPLVEERLHVVLHVVHVPVDDAVPLDFLNLVDVPAFVCAQRRVL